MDAKKALKAIFILLRVVIVCGALAFAAMVLTTGMFLIGFPRESQVAQVTVTKLETGETAVYDQPEAISEAVKDGYYLRYRPFAEITEEDTPLVQVDYTLKNGTVKTVQAGSSCVWWNGHVYEMRNGSIFAYMMLNIFGS